MPLKGRTMSYGQKLKISLAHRGKKKPWAKSPTKGKQLPRAWVIKAALARTGLKRSIATRLKQSLALRGSKSSGWRGGIGKTNNLIRNSSKYKYWRSAVFRRDNYTCQVCGAYGGKLNADHIKPFAYFLELRFKLSNGRTLCVPCHKKTDTYSRRYKIEPMTSNTPPNV